MMRTSCHVLFAAVAILCLSVQAVHLVEHFAQVGVWLAGFQEKLYMTPLGMWCMDRMSELFSHLAPAHRAQMGFETLHLVGNAIFVIGIATLFYFTRTRMILWAFWVEAFHLYEHICLTFSAYFLQKAVGMSTFYGADVSPWLLLSYRVWWHFLFNLVPSVLVVFVLHELFRKQKR